MGIKVIERTSFCLWTDGHQADRLIPQTLSVGDKKEEEEERRIMRRDEGVGEEII